MSRQVGYWKCCGFKIKITKEQFEKNAISTCPICKRLPSKKELDEIREQISKRNKFRILGALKK